MNTEDIFKRLQGSKFRASQRLSPEEQSYLADVGLQRVVNHAERLLRERLAPATPKNDGSQTPYRGHPVFVAQHATAMCCRTCLHKWHGLEKGRDLTPEEIGDLVVILAEWLHRQPRGAKNQISFFD